MKPAILISCILILGFLYIGSPARTDTDNASEIEVSASITLTGISISVTGASAAQANSDDYQRLIEEVSRRVKEAYLCGIGGRSYNCL